MDLSSRTKTESCRAEKVIKYGLSIAAISTFALATAASSAFAITPPIHLLVLGRVELKRSSWSRYELVKPVAVLYSNDLLRSTQGAQIKVLCSDLKVRTVPTGSSRKVSDLCPQVGKPSLRSGESIVGDTRGGSSSLIPYIISPRNTSLFNAQPTLRWNALSSATSYEVQVRGPGVNWETNTSATKVIYPGKPPLQPGFRYWLTVVANNGASSQDESVPGFSMLERKNAQQVLADVKELKQQQLPNEAEALALAHLYRSNNLNAEASELLERLVKDGSQAIAVYQLLGYLYWQVGLNLLAKERYLGALELAKAAGDVEGQAAVQAELGKVVSALGNDEEALHWLEKAKAGYTALGDRQYVRELEQRRTAILQTEQ